MSMNVGQSRFFRALTVDPRGRGACHRDARARIDALHAHGRKGLWGLLLFTTLCAAAAWSLPLQAEIPGPVRELLGPAPPVQLISVALAVYCFSALIRALPRLADGSETYHGWSHMAYLGGFYVFYFYAGALEGNFWALLAGGLLLLGLEYAGLLSYSRCALRAQQEESQRPASD